MFGKTHRPNNNIHQTRGHERGGKGSAYPISMLGDGCSFVGKMFLQGEARIGGQIEGLVVSEGSLTIEETAKIIGDVKGINVQVSGYIDGSVAASGVLCLTSKARIRGGISAVRLTVEDGAHISGNVSTDEHVADQRHTAANHKNEHSNETQPEQKKMPIVPPYGAAS